MLLELFIVFLKLGTFTIGGGIAMLPLLQNSMINEKKWFTEEEFVDMIAVCQGLPGVVAVNMATYVGFKKKGLLGSLVATLGVLIPSFIIILIIAGSLNAIGDSKIVAGAMAGFRAAALGLVLVSVFQLGKTVFKDKLTVALAIVSFAMITVFKINTAYVILLFLAYGVATAYYAKKKIESKGGQGK